MHSHNTFSGGIWCIRPALSHVCCPSRDERCHLRAMATHLRQSQERVSQQAKFEWTLIFPRPDHPIACIDFMSGDFIIIVLPVRLRLVSTGNPRSFQIKTDGRFDWWIPRDAEAERSLRGLIAAYRAHPVCPSNVLRREQVTMHSIDIAH